MKGPIIPHLIVPALLVAGCAAEPVRPVPTAMRGTAQRPGSAPGDPLSHDDGWWPREAPGDGSWFDVWLLTGPLVLTGGDAEERSSRRDTPSGGKDAGAESLFSRYGIGLAFSKALPKEVAATPYVELQESFGRSKGHGMWNITDVHAGLRVQILRGRRASPYVAADVGYAHWEGQRPFHHGAPADHGGITFGVRVGVEFRVHRRVSLGPEFLFRTFDATTRDYDARWIGLGLAARFPL